jgi:hypothetical protein
MNLNGTPVATGDAAGANPFYNGGTITARDYVWAYGFRNPFGGAWRGTRHWDLENGNQIDRMVDVVAGQNLGWNGTDTSLAANAKYVWDPAIGPVNLAFTQASTFGGSLFPAGSMGDGFVSLSGPTYASGPQAGSKNVLWFPDMDTLSGGKLSVAPITLVNYNGTGKATVVALTAGPDGLYFSDFYRDDGVGGATASGSNVYRIRYTDFHPDNVAATLSAGKVSLTWTADPLATSYNVYRSSNGGARTKIASNVSGTSYNDTTIVNGTPYDYVVLGVNAGGESNDSNVAHVSGSIPTSYVGTSAADSWYLKRNGTNLEIWVGGTGGVGSPTYSLAYSSAGALSFSGQAGADALTIDNSAGNAIPTAGVSFDGGADSDTFKFIGTSSSDSVTFNASTFVIGITTGTITNVESRVFTGGGGGDNLSINGGRVTIPSTQSIANLDTSGGVLDVADEAVVFPYSTSSPIGSWTGSTYDGVTGQIKSGRNGGAWNGGTGITSGNANANLRSVGVAEASGALKISGTQTGTFAGLSVDATTVLVKFTYGGDANLDGKVDVDDYGRIDANVTTGNRGWYNGDFNYDGKINVDDYGILDFNLGSQGAPITGALSTFAVPSTSLPAVVTPQNQIKPLAIDRTDLTNLLA